MLRLPALLIRVPSALLLRLHFRLHITRGRGGVDLLPQRAQVRQGAEPDAAISHRVAVVLQGAGALVSMLFVRWLSVMAAGAAELVMVLRQHAIVERCDVGSAGHLAIFVPA